MKCIQPDPGYCVAGPQTLTAGSPFQPSPLTWAAESRANHRIHQKSELVTLQNELPSVSL